MSSVFIGAFSCPSGYFDSSEITHLCLFNSKLIEVYSYCFYRVSPCLPFNFDDESEVEWFIVNHPLSYYKKINT